MSDMNIHVCGSSRLYVPDSACDDCDRALYLIEQLTSRINAMRFDGYRGKFVGDGSVKSSVTLSIPNYTYASSDTFLVFLNGLNLVASEFAVSGSGNSVTVQLVTPADMEPVDVLEVVVLKYKN